MLHRIAYASIAQDRLPAAELSRIIGVTRSRNPALGMTGALVYSGSHFLQVLEGLRPELATLFDRIRADRSHHDVVLLVDGPCAERWFQDCRAGYLYERMPAERLEALHANGGLLAEADLERLRALLSEADLW